MTPCVVALQSMRSFTKTRYSMTQKAVYFVGRDEIDRIAGVIKATHPDFEYQPLFPRLPPQAPDSRRPRSPDAATDRVPARAAPRGGRALRNPESGVDARDRGVDPPHRHRVGLAARASV